VAGLGVPRGEEEDGGPGDAHARALGGGGRLTTTHARWRRVAVGTGEAR
jgi:hypothetical protein